MKKIRMYNVGFGSCFCLRDRKESLLVDFGSCNRKIGGRSREEVFDLVSSDLSTIERKNLLLTQFYPDHLSGLLYLARGRGLAGEFGTVYLPDVFSDGRMDPVLVLLLLADLMEGSYLPGRQVSLAALLEILCACGCEVCLLRRGDLFGGKYQAIWPDGGWIAGKAEKLAGKLPERLGAGWRALCESARQMRLLVQGMTEQGHAGGGGPDPGAQWLSVSRQFARIRRSQEVRQLLQYFEDEKVDLQKFRYYTGTAFQSARDGELNVLFPGDLPPECLRMAADNDDGKVPLFEHYWCIQVPHHGTQSHYFDFSPYTPDNLLISNGLYYGCSRRREKESRVSGQYAGLFYIKDATMHCASTGCCEGHLGGCSCREREIIEPGYYRDL